MENIECSKSRPKIESLIADLKNLKDYSRRIGNPEDADNLAEAIDIIYDYEKISPKYGEMTVHFEVPQKPVRRSGVWCCPSCGKRVNYHHTHCHWCGKKMGWGK